MTECEGNRELIPKESISNTLNWKFANQTSICRQNGTQKAYINQCGISRIGSNYLKVPLKSLQYDEKACIYCQVDYKPIVALIRVTQSDLHGFITYNFNITATGLGYNESFEILWAKRAHGEIRYSFNYWFSQKCIDSRVDIILNTGHMILFTVNDLAINRAEFIIRRCNGTCRNYDSCSQEELNKDIASNHLKIPDSIEKISCDNDCLNDASITTITVSQILSSSTTETSLSVEQTVVIIILVATSGLLLLMVLIICILYIWHKMKRRKHVYSATSNVDPDEY
ncbi:unnamed protein product [Rotaria sp. Silwood1]|nr:unnamed protein product [Rotaria sp. Silwood1]